MQRPQDIIQLASVVDRLVTYGGVRAPKDTATYLRSVGVAAADDKSEWHWPTQNFLTQALPALDMNDLIRRVVIRDPQYRLHIDLSMCSVIHSVAISERWPRFEELMFGQCKMLAPRFGQILSWLSSRLEQPIRAIPSVKFQQAIVENAVPVFRDWDAAIWGDSRGPADLFPLLLDLYVPLLNQPCHVHSAADVNHTLLASLIAAAKNGEGLILPAGQLADLRVLQAQGLPIRVEPRPNRSAYAYVIGTIELVSDECARIGDLAEVHSGLTDHAKRSRLIPPVYDCPRWSVQSHSELLAPTSVDHNTSRWPNETVTDSPDWLTLPGSDLISTAAKRRTDSLEADVALQQVARHPLYGFILQLFLIEALDRELGEETLALALPQNRKLESLDDWAATNVLYRPRYKSDENQDQDKVQESELDGFLVLGSIDQVVPIIGREVGINGVATPYHSDALPWSRAIYLMSTAGIVDGRPHSWRLTITSFILDRLHSGSLMKDVIRGGRAFRDRIHEVLSELWKEQTRTVGEEQIPA